MLVLSRNWEITNGSMVLCLSKIPLHKTTEVDGDPQITVPVGISW